MKQIIPLIILVLSTVFQTKIISKKFIITRDPFNPNPIESLSQTQNYSEKSFKVTGIIWDKESPSTVIQFPRFKKIFNIGDSINNHKITTITKKYIELTTSSNKIMVKLGEEKIFE
ncbi:hypothetical protein CL658_01105 [bacterium]|nr:hypothetical protein [bacterium]|tara:strand:- start:1116 stop:1463 length:348 start_codon:yes stop_codon:yes gene_type:complete